MKKFILGLVSLSLGLLVGCGAQNAQNAQNPQEQGNGKKYPEKEITLVVPYAPGGASDATARIIAKNMEETLKVPVVTVNKTGGTGGVGMTFVQTSANDGYTFGYVPVEMSMHKALGLSEIEPSKFDLIGQATMIPAAITVPADAPYNTIEEFIEYAKQNPGKIKVGNSGVGSIWHIASTVFAEKANVQLTDVPFDGAAPAVTALMGKHVDAVTVSIGEVKSGVVAKKLKVLAVMSAERDKNFPDVPTLKEKGIDAEITAWGGFVLPKGSPDEVKTVLANALKEAVNSEEFKRFADERGMTVAYKSPEEFAQFAESQFQFFSQLIPKLELK
jgi:tripartite-type tricarboxylate transporter receptor subunit TctC